MPNAYVVEMDDEGASTYYVVDEATFREAMLADDGEEGLMDWFDYDHMASFPTFHSNRDLTQHLRENDLELTDEVKGYFY